MVASNALLLGAVLRFADGSGSSLELDVYLARPASVSIRWDGRVSTSTVPKDHHRLGPWSAPRGAPAPWTLTVESGERHRGEVPDFDQRPFRVAVYGDSRGGSGPQAELVQAMVAWRPHAVVHTGHLLDAPGDDEGWTEFVEVAGALTSRAPHVVVEGSHAAPRDLGARELETSAGLRRVGLGPATLFVLDSDASLDPESSQLRGLEAGWAGTRLGLVALHHGPLSSGPHGGHSEGEALLEVLARLEPVAVFSGHDHVYERLGRGRTAFVVSGGGGAPLHERERIVEGSAGLVSAYHWVAIELFEDRAHLEARSLDGLVLDRARLPPSTPYRASGSWGGLIGAIACGLIGVGIALRRILLRPPETSGR